MQHESVAARIEIGAADHDHAVEHFDEPLQVVLVGNRRHDDRNAPDGDDRVVVAGGHIGERRSVLGRSSKVCVQTDQRLVSHLNPFPFSTHPVSGWSSFKSGSRHLATTLHSKSLLRSRLGASPLLKLVLE